MSNAKQCDCGVKMLCCGCNKGPYLSNAGDRYNCVNTKIVKNERTVTHNVTSDSKELLTYYIPVPAKLPVMQTEYLDKASFVSKLDNFDTSVYVDINQVKNILRKFTINSGETVRSYLFIPIIKDEPFMYKAVYEDVEVAKTRYFGPIISDQYKSNQFCFFHNAFSRCYLFDAIFASFPVAYPDLYNQYEDWLINGQNDVQTLNDRVRLFAPSDLVSRIRIYIENGVIQNVDFLMWFFFLYAWNKFPPDQSQDFPWVTNGRTPRFIYATVDEAISDKWDYRKPVVIRIPELSPDSVIYGLYKEIGNEEIDFNITYDTLMNMSVGEIRTSYKRHIFKEVDNRDLSWILGFNTMLQSSPFSVPDTGNNLGTPGWGCVLSSFYGNINGITRGEYPDLDAAFRLKIKKILGEKDIKLIHNNSEADDYNDMDILCKARLYEPQTPPNEYLSSPCYFDENSTNGIIQESDFQSSISGGQFVDYTPQYGYFDQSIVTIGDSNTDIGVNVVRDGEKTFLMIKDLIAAKTVIDTGSWTVIRTQTLSDAVIYTHVKSQDNNLMTGGPCFKTSTTGHFTDYEYSLYIKNDKEKISYPMIGPVPEQYRPVVDVLTGNKPTINVCRFARVNDVLNGWGGDDTVLFCPSNAKVSCCSHGYPTHSMINLEEGLVDSDMKIIYNNHINKLTQLTSSSIYKSDTEGFNISDYQNKNDDNVHDLTDFVTGSTYLTNIGGDSVAICEVQKCSGDLKYRTFKPNTISVKSSVNSLNEIHKNLIEDIRRNFLPRLILDCVKLKGNTNTGRFIDLSFAESSDSGDTGSNGQYYVNEHHLSFDAIKTYFLDKVNPCYNDLISGYVAEDITAIKKGENYYPKRYKVYVYVQNYNSLDYSSGSTGYINYDEQNDSWGGIIPMYLTGYFTETSDITNYGNNIDIQNFGYEINLSMSIDDSENITFSNGNLVEQNRCKLALFGISFTGSLPLVVDIQTSPLVINRPANFILIPEYLFNTRRTSTYSAGDLFYTNLEGEDRCLF